jgi:hypothetical protein
VVQKNDVGQKFCRSCGLNLEQISIAVLEQLPLDSPPDLDREQRLMEKFGAFAMTGFGIVLAIGIFSLIYVIIWKMIWSGTQPLSGLLLVAFIIFAALALGYVFWSESLTAKRQMMRPTLSDLPPSLPPAKLADSTFEPVPTVTENTTSKLKIKT